MRGMILAAGRGERARPLSDTIPKPLFPVAGRPLVAYPLGMLKGAGITDIVVNVHHLADQIEEQLRQCDGLGLRISLSREQQRLETGGGIAHARSLLGDDTFVAVNGDVICDIDLAAVIEEHSLTGAICTMVLRENPDPEHIPVVEWHPMSQHVLDIRRELGVTSRTSRPMMFTGIHVLDPTVFEYVLPMPESIIDAFYLPALRENRHVHGYAFDGYWAELGTEANYRAVCQEIAGRKLEHVEPLSMSPTSSL